MKKSEEILRTIIVGAFCLCLGATIADVLLRRVNDVATGACKIADEYQASLARDIRSCSTEMCVVFFQDRAAVAEEECSLETGVKTKPVELPVTEKY